MTPNEFKAWFDGFTEAFTGCPTKAQWTRIKARVAEIDGKSVTERVYVDRYVQQYPYCARPYWQYLGGGSAVGLLYNSSAIGQAQRANNMLGSGGEAYNSLQAMNALGQAEGKLS